MIMELKCTVSMSSVCGLESVYTAANPMKALGQFFAENSRVTAALLRPENSRAIIRVIDDRVSGASPFQKASKFF